MVQRKRQDSNLQLLTERLLSKQLPSHSDRFLKINYIPNICQEVQVGFKPTNGGFADRCVKSLHH